MKLKTLLPLLAILIFPLTGRADTLQKICGSNCAGPMASVTPWIDSQGKTQVFEFRGDLSACSHPPLIFFDSEGKEVLTIPEVPINPQDPVQSARFKELHEKKEGLLKGLKRGKVKFCPSH